MVAVISKTGEKLMPTNEYRARKLLKKGKAVIHKYSPFTIQLTERETGETQPVELCVDTGYQHIGISVKSEKHEYLREQVDLLPNEREKHNDCRSYRKTRRNRKRYRKPRFDNRKRPEKWLPPSIRHKMEAHISRIRRVYDVFPVTEICLEMGNFDTQLLKAIEEGKPIPQGEDYQHGERYQTGTLREAVFSRDNYTCQCCERTISDEAILHVHHIIYRSMGGTNRMANLATVCEKCHTPKNHQPGGKLWNWKPKLASFKGATFMTTVRWIMRDVIQAEIPDANITITYGAATKESRRKLGIEKSHSNDAYAMGRFHPKHRAVEEVWQKVRRNNRILERFYDAKYIDIRDGKKRTGKELANGRTNRNHKTDTENLRKYRGEKISKGRRAIRKKRYTLQPHDIVLYEGKKYSVKGCHNNGTRVILDNKKSIAISKVKVLSHTNGYYKK